MFGLFFHHQVVLQFYEHEFVELACQCPAVVVCRCSPTQKADIVQLLKVHTDKATCAIGGWSLCVDRSIYTSVYQSSYGALKVLKNLEFDWTKFKALKSLNFTK